MLFFMKRKFLFPPEETPKRRWNEPPRLLSEAIARTINRHHIRMVVGENSPAKLRTEVS